MKKLCFLLKLNKKECQMVKVRSTDIQKVQNDSKGKLHVYSYDKVRKYCSCCRIVTLKQFYSISIVQLCAIRQCNRKHSNRVFTPAFDNEINIYIFSNSQHADDYNFDIPVTYLTIKYRVKNNFSVEYPLTTYFYPSVTPKLKNDM